MRIGRGNRNTFALSIMLRLKPGIRGKKPAISRLSLVQYNPINESKSMSTAC
jgi:hypothetical protein